MLADAAAVLDGKLYIHGGGWDQLASPRLPFTVPNVALVLVIEHEWDETHTDMELQVQIYDEDGKPTRFGAIGTIRVGRPIMAKPGAPVSNPLVLTFPNLTVQRTGRYIFRVQVNGEEIGSVPFSVYVPREPPLPPGVQPPS